MQAAAAAAAAAATMGGASVTVPLVDIVVEPVATRASWFRSLKSLWLKACSLPRDSGR